MQLTTLSGIEDRQFKIGVDPFKDMPTDDYEVARLHFLWDWPYIEYKLKPMGDRLLVKNPDDAEVLWADSYLCTHFGTGDELLGVSRAQRAMQLAPCPRTYARYADARAMMCLRRKDASDNPVAQQYFQKYLADARKDDPSRAGAQKTLAWLEKHQ